MMTRKTYLTIAITAIVGLVPPILVYAQGRAELREKYAHTNAEAEAGYTTMVDSVRELRATVAAQSETISRLQGHIELIESVMQRGDGMRMASAKPLPPAPPSPKFEELPANLDAAQMQLK